MSFNSKASKRNLFTFSYVKKHQVNGRRLKSGSNEETEWTNSHEAGNFSTFDLSLNTGVNNHNIDPSSIAITTSGLRVGWSYSQSGVTMKDSDSFVVHGTVTWGVDISGIPLAYDQDMDIRIDIDWSNGTCTWTEL